MHGYRLGTFLLAWNTTRKNYNWSSARWHVGDLTLLARKLNKIHFILQEKKMLELISHLINMIHLKRDKKDDEKKRKFIFIIHFICYQFKCNMNKQFCYYNYNF